MAMVTIRRQGGAAIMTIPTDVIRALDIGVGAKLDVSVVDGALTARPRAVPARKRYALKELLEGASPALMRSLAEETGWAREGEAIGREV